MTAVARQSRLDSFLETLINTAVGYLVAMAMYAFVIEPLYGLKTSTTENLGIVGLFTLASIIRQYFIRRVLDGRSVYRWIKEDFA